MRALWEALLELVYPTPAGCVLCRSKLAPDSRNACCPDCVQTLADLRAGPVCQLCGKFLTEGHQSLICLDCQAETPAYSLARAVGPYAGGLKEAVHRLKYQKKRQLAGPLGKLMAEVVRTEPAYRLVELVIPVPLHQDKQRRRGFNQARLLAETLAGKLGLPVDSSILVRRLATLAQTGLGRAERRQNLADAFMVNKPASIQGKNVLLVDDVMTTGSTVGECSRALVAAGARQVLVVVVAAGHGK